MGLNGDLISEHLTKKNEQIEWTKLGKGSTITKGLDKMYYMMKCMQMFMLEIV